MPNLNETMYRSARALLPRRAIEILSTLYLNTINFLKYGDPYFFKSVAIEICTYCNRKCYYCPNSTNETPEEYIPKELFIRALERLKELHYTGIVDYSLYNEPLTDDRLPEFVKLTKEYLPGSIIRIFTNGDFLTPQLCGELIDNGVSLFSVTQHDKDEKYFMEKMQPLIDKFRDNINLNCIHSIPLSNRGGSVNLKDKNKASRKTCSTADGTLVITYTGDITLCCNDYFKKHVFGNIEKASIKNIWNKKSFKGIRKELRKGVARLDICKQCLDMRHSNSSSKNESHIKKF